jgi:hypothetical protein
MEGRLYEPAGAESLAVWSIPPAVGLTGVEPETTILPARFSRNSDGCMRRLSASDDTTAADYGDDRMLERVRYVMRQTLLLIAPRSRRTVASTRAAGPTATRPTRWASRPPSRRSTSRSVACLCLAHRQISRLAMPDPCVGSRTDRAIRSSPFRSRGSAPPRA